MTDGAVRGCVGAVTACPPWPGQRHPWADLNPLGLDDRLRALPDLASVGRVLKPTYGVADRAREVPAGVGGDWQAWAAVTDLGRALGVDRAPDGPLMKR
jgi:hypothetical protein